MIGTTPDHSTAPCMFTFTDFHDRVATDLETKLRAMLKDPLVLHDDIDRHLNLYAQPLPLVQDYPADSIDLSDCAVPLQRSTSTTFRMESSPRPIHCGRYLAPLTIDSGKHSQSSRAVTCASMLWRRTSWQNAVKIPPIRIFCDLTDKSCRCKLHKDLAVLLQRLRTASG